MKKLRVNMCFNEVDNQEVIRLIEQGGIKRPSGLIHDLVRKGLLFDRLLSGQLIQNLGTLNSVQVDSPVETELRGKAPQSEKVVTDSPSAKPQPKVKAEPVEITPEPVKRVEPVVQEPVAEGAVVMDLSSLGDLGCNFD